MTAPADLAAALLKDVPKYTAHHVVSTISHPEPVWLHETEVLAALSRALDPAIAERAGDVLEGVTPGPWTLCRLADQTPHSIQASYGCINGLSALFTLAHINAPDEAEVGMTDGAFDRETADANARFIAWCREGVPALLAQNAALRAEVRKSAMDAVSAGCQAQEAYEAQKAAEAERDALRYKLQAMHRRAQRVEGKSHRTAHLLETILRSVKDAMKPDAKLSLHSLYHRICAARDHARASSGRAWSEGWHYFRPKLDAAEAQIAALTARVEGLTGALEKINVGEGWAAQIARAALTTEERK